MRLPSGAHLTYCTNIHPGETWAEVLAVLSQALPSLKARVAPERALGVGLRLSARAALELERDERCFQELLALLAEVDGYVPTLNGFPYGEFHRGPVKAAVYLPDWHDPARAEYTLRLARLLARLAKERPGGPERPSISTVPGCFRSAAGPGSPATVAENLRNVALGLARLEAETGVAVTVGLEPEPACLLETTSEGAELLTKMVYDGPGLLEQAARAGHSSAVLADVARRHLGLCLDACHAAVGFESAPELVALLRKEQVLVTKLQVTSALELPEATPRALEALAQFADGVYLHQVGVRTPGGLLRFVDLPEALSDPSLLGHPWRVHFHVPVSEEKLGELSTTRPFLEAILRAQREAPLTDQLEVETYTYDVLPSPLKGRSVVDVIARELEWTWAQVCA